MLEHVIDKFACFCLLSCCLIHQASSVASALCNGAKVAYQYNLRPEFNTPVEVAATSALIEMRLCIGSNTSVANVGIQSLGLQVSADGEVWSQIALDSERSCPHSPHVVSLFSNSLYKYL
jgi:hypothetical protein